MKKNPVAKAVRSEHFRQKIVEQKKGCGSYKKESKIKLLKYILTESSLNQKSE